MVAQVGALLFVSYLATTAIAAGVYNGSKINYGEDDNTSSLLRISWDEESYFGGEDWFVAPPLLPIYVANSSFIRNPRCRLQSRLFLHQLQNFTLWAVQMFDAAAKLPVGMVAGNQYQMGHFDECLGISVDTGEIHGGPLKGQYCLAEIKVESPIPSTADPYTLDYDPMMSAWSKIKYGYDPSKVRRDVIHWALCVPDSCTSEEVDYVLQQELKKIGNSYGAFLTSKVSPNMCQTLEPEEPLTTGAIIYLAILTLLIALMILSTWHDFTFSDKMPEKENESGMKIPPKLNRILLCFSARRNMNKLMSVNPVQPAIDAAHGPRFLFMLFIIMGHRLTTYGGHPIFNAEIEEAMFRDVPSMILANGPIIVDGFFALSGVMLCYPLLLHLHKLNKINLAMPIIIRFFRLTPSYMMLVFFYATLMPYMGSGPFWKSIVLEEQQKCADNWWTNLLYINNYVKIDQMCMFQSWYVSADFHLYIISLILVYCVWRWPRLGYTMLGIFTTLSVIVPFILIYQSHAPALLQPYPENIIDVRENWFFQTIYVATQNRATPYFVGVIVGIVLFKLRNNTYKLAKLPSQMLYFGSWGLGVVVILFAYVFFIPGRPYDALEAALYGSLKRLGFGVAIAGFFIAMTCGQIDGHQRFLSSKACVVLSRLTYGAYLAHTMGQMYDQASLRLPRFLSGYTVLWLTIADFTFAFTIALFLLLLIEAPFRALEKIVFGKT